MQEGRKNLWSHVFGKEEKEKQKAVYKQSIHTMISSLDLEDVATVAKVEGSGLGGKQEMGEPEEPEPMPMPDSERRSPEPMPVDDM